MNVVRFAAVMLTTSLTIGAASPVAGLRGFTPLGASYERQYEATFLDVPSASGALETARMLDAQPHYPGTPGDYAVATAMRDKLASFGFDARLEEVRARVDSPKKLVLEILGKPKIGLDLYEHPDPRDPETARTAAGIPFNSGSADGDVRATLVYANRGLEQDYATLAAAHVNVQGTIVLIRYGAQFRGLLAERAQAHRAAGVIFYSDPKDDGFAKGATSPNGPYRPEGSVQRGDVGTNVRIPVLPVNALNGAKLLSIINGVAAPRSWDGALSVPYVIGVSKAPVHLAVQLTRKTPMIWNTIGMIEGSDPSQSVILGGHRDAWAYGVTDNGAGISTLLEVARGIGYLHRSGWRPKRTIIIAGWDGEEIGEVGSRGYVDAHKLDLTSGCVAYINSDESAAGPQFYAEAAGALGAMIAGASQSIDDPRTAHVSLFESWKRANHGRPSVDSPSGGSDFEPFLHDAGVPTIDAGFSGPLGVYHSLYDDLTFATNVADPNFTRHRALAQLLGVLALRLADADAVPYLFSGYVPTLRRAVAKAEASARARNFYVNGLPLRRSVERFAVAARTWDARGPQPGRNRDALAAAQEIDSTLYGAIGYDPVLLPAITSAISDAQPAAVIAAFARAAAAIDDASTRLK